MPAGIGYDDDVEACYDCGRKRPESQMMWRERYEGGEGMKTVMVCASCDRDNYGIPGVPGM